MLDIKFICENPEKVKQNILNRRVDPKKADVDKLMLLDGRKIKLNSEIEQLRAAKNKFASELKDEKLRTPEKIEEGKKIKEGIEILEKELREVEQEWQEIMDWIPNILADDVPVGKDENDNLEIKAWTSESGYFSKEKLGLKDFSKKWMPTLNFSGKDHVALGKNLGIIDVEQSAKTSGSRFAYLKDDLVVMQYALFDLLFKKLITDYKFHPMIVPLLVKEKVLYGTSHLPEGRDQVYKIENANVEENKDLFLVGSSEPPLFSYFMDKTVDKKDLPYKMCAYSSCFRSEVGSWGKDVRGIKRVHQFDKLEIDVVCSPEDSQKIFDELLEINEWFFQSLKLPYHQILKCTGDSGYSASHRQVDTEVWLPSQKEFIEVGTDTNALDFQARRLNIKCEDKRYAHTVNDTGCPMGRVLIAIIDNYQDADGSVTVPEVLQNYVGKKILTP
ncbi:serine--tRNA ligase [Candidatus Gottesmanbacteria bacterium]|nr:serine--tRNA ligase [Candidatus Gottesmanbacteria bacterium]